jgi:hypothetical protein
MGKKHNTINSSAERLPKAARKDVCNSISMDFVARRLMELKLDAAWDLFVKMNELLMGDEAWMRHAPEISRQLRERMQQQELNQKRIMLLMELTAASPKTQNFVYPQAGSTTNVGCELLQPEFKMIEKKGDPCK